MQRWWRLSVQAASGLVLAASCLATPPAAAAPITVRDDLGRTVQLAAPARRVVSMLPSLTETVCALGACGKLVGVDRYSNFPASVKSLAQVGGLDDANVEAIVALKPDLVLLAQSARIIDRLQALGLTVVVLEPHTQADVRRALEQVALLVGSREAAPAWQRIQEGMAAARRELSPQARGLSVYYEVAGGPYAASEGSYVGELLSGMGLRNIVPASLGPFPKLNPEFVVRADPALILMGHRNASGLLDRPGWARIRALSEQRVCRFEAEVGDVLARPGPRLGEAALVMARCINGAVSQARPAPASVAAQALAGQLPPAAPP